MKVPQLNVGELIITYEQLANNCQLSHLAINIAYYFRWNEDRSIRVARPRRYEDPINLFDIFCSFLAPRHFFSGRGKPLEQVQRFLRNADWKLLARPTERFKIREKHRVKSIEVVRRPARERMV